MPENSSSPILKRGPLVVATISHIAEWEMARSITTATENAPDLFEVRADLLLENQSDLPGKISELRLPVILTVRHPAEGGKGSPDSAKRGEIYRKYGGDVAAIDLELAFADQFPDLIEDCHARGKACLFSYHHFTDTPTLEVLQEKTHAAVALGANLFKAATTTDRNQQLGTLLEWLAWLEQSRTLPVAVMGMGRLGKISRPLLAQLGSQLNYGYLAQPLVSGQWSAFELKKIIRSLVP